MTTQEALTSPRKAATPATGASVLILTGELNEHFLHYSFNKGMDAWYEKHNRYSLHEARESLEHRRMQAPDLRGLFDRDPRGRRRALKQLSYWMPFRPLLRFLYMYIFRLGILDGWAGYTYCSLLASVVKIAELQRHERGLPV